ncbi:restriction endonuclease subunit S [Micromonospora sp. SCSIO 07396]
MTDLPPGWTVAPLGELVDVLDSQRVPVSAKERAERPGSVPYYGAAGQVGFIDAAIFDEDLVLLGEDGVQFFDPYKDKAYRIAGPAWVNNHAHVLRPRGMLEIGYLHHYLNSFDYRGFANGTTRLKLTQAAMNRIPVSLPPIDEQRRIVEAIEQALSRLAFIRSMLSKVALRIDRFRDDVLNRAVLGEISASISATYTANCFSELAGKNGQKIDYRGLPKLPPSWKWRVAREACSAIFSGSTPAAALMSAGAGDIPFLKVYNLAGKGSVDFSVRPTFVNRSTHEGLLRRSRVVPGDVLTNIVGPPLGKTAVVPSRYEEWNINQAIVSFRAGCDMQPAWLALVLQAPIVLNLLKGTAKATAGQFNVALSTCRELPLPVPPIVAQKKITDVVELILDQVKVTADLVARTEKRVESLRTSLLCEAFAGRLVPQDPNDEPAAELLARIRAERSATIPKQRTRSRRTPKELAAPPTRVTGDDYQQETLPL